MHMKYGILAGAILIGCCLIERARAQEPTLQEILTPLLNTVCEIEKTTGAKAFFALTDSSYLVGNYTMPEGVKDMPPVMQLMEGNNRHEVVKLDIKFEYGCQPTMYKSVRHWKEYGPI